MSRPEDFSPLEAADRLYCLCNELPNYHVPLEYCEQLRHVSLRFTGHINQLVSYQERLQQVARGCYQW